MCLSNGHGLFFSYYDLRSVSVPCKEKQNVFRVPILKEKKNFTKLEKNLRVFYTITLHKHIVFKL